MVLLFYGPSGTGKTMMANALAALIGKKARRRRQKAKELAFVQRKRREYAEEHLGKMRERQDRLQAEALAARKAKKKASAAVVAFA